MEIADRTRRVVLVAQGRRRSARRVKDASSNRYVDVDVG
jgi:hypothetical protein